MTTPVLAVRDLRLRRGTREILRGVSFDAVRGEIPDNGSWVRRGLTGCRAPHRAQ